MKGCSGPCEQGKKPCYTPEACEVAELSWKLSDLAVAAIFVGFLAAFFGGLFG